jgi:hypothetical protein
MQKMGGVHTAHEFTKGKPGSLLWIHDLDVLQPYPRSAIVILRESSHHGVLVTTGFQREQVFTRLRSMEHAQL